MQSLDHILQSVFGLRQFRPRQREIIEDILKGRDVVCVMPTGAGKSLCFQLPAVTLRGLTIIVSPLISLMADQVHHLQKLKVPALFLNSSQSLGEQRKVLALLWEGFDGLLYIAPERFSAPSFQRLVPRLKPRLFVVDEAHCVSFWGHDFRPEYMRLSEVRKQLGSPTTVAVTATATPQVRNDMIAMLDLRSPAMHVTGFDRPNLTYACRHFDRAGDKDAALLRFLQHRTGCGIVYCSTRKAVEQLAALFEEHFPDRALCAYHAGMNPEARRRSQAKFMKAEKSIVVATNAFGMGINKPDIRFVVHYNLPGSVEAYYQEAGRAGRDGKPANCVLFFNNRDLSTQRFFIDNIGENNDSLSKEEVARLQRNASRKLDMMLTYAETQRCRRRQILDYFGESTAITDCECDVCQGASFHRYQPDVDASSGSRHGKGTERNLQSRTSQKPIPTQARGTIYTTPLDGAAEARFERLRKVRKQIADENSWPAFCILQDRVLREVAREAPNSIEDLTAIKGVGATKAQKFGPAFLKAMVGSDEAQPHAPAAIPPLPPLVSKTGFTKTSIRVSAENETTRPDLSQTQPTGTARPMSAGRDTQRAPSVSAANVLPRITPHNTSEAPLDRAAQVRFDRLLQVRAIISEAQNYPPFCILLDGTLREVARVSPRSLDALARIPGVGPRKAARFGASFLRALQDE